MVSVIVVNTNIVPVEKGTRRCPLSSETTFACVLFPYSAFERMGGETRRGGNSSLGTSHQLVAIFMDVCTARVEVLSVVCCTHR